jgi:hypothetical protein
MWPMFSERFDTRQPSAEFYPLWTAAVSRYQYLLRQGKPRVDVGILRTDHFTDNMSGFAFLDHDGNRVPDEDAYGRWWMRNRQNHWWQDLGMQDAGWTYEFFDGALLLRDEVSFAAGLVQPDGPGYQALIVFQSELDADAAGKVLEWARQGLKVVIVHGTRELKQLLDGQYWHHDHAAARTPGLDGRDGELAETMKALTALPTVAEIDDPSGTVATLRSLGVIGRAEFTNDNPNVLSHLREDGDLLHLYLYHFLYETGEPTTVQVALPGTGAVYRVDVWTGAIRPHTGSVELAQGRSMVTVDLAPGETALFILDRAVSGRSHLRPARSETVAELSEWTITVESWDAGDSELITEDRGLGYVTGETRPTTRIARLDAGNGRLRPWQSIATIGPEVSGIGEYTATLPLEHGPQEGERYVLDLGSTGGGLGAARVNDGDPIGFDTSRPLVDVTSALHTGINTVTIRVASSLNNRLLARGYYESLVDVGARILGKPPTMQTTDVHDHGLLGPVRLLRERA